jgi:hypothetical protein
VVSPVQPFSRRLASRLFNTIVRLLFGLRLTDTQCGAKVFRYDVLQPILENLGVTSWAFDVDMLFQAKRAGASIREMPTVWHDKAGSKIKMVRSSVGMAAALVRLRMYYSPFRFMIPYVSRIIEAVFPYRKR